MVNDGQFKSQIEFAWKALTNLQGIIHGTDQKKSLLQAFAIVMVTSLAVVLKEAAHVTT